MIQGPKVITTEEMSRIEKLAYEGGASPLAFMEKAGEGVADFTEEYCLLHDLEKSVMLLVGKGNNGGDAFAAGKTLLKRGFFVEALHFYPFEQCSPLCQQQYEMFKAAGGRVRPYEKGRDLAKEDSVLLDGLVGTGFKGKAEGELKEAIELANASKLPILAIDIPSGLNGTIGEVGSVAIEATETIYLGLPKLGFFIGQGWNHVGILKHVDFGMDEKFIKEAKASAFLLDQSRQNSGPCALPKMERNRHKYQAGYIVAVAGSSGFAGAAFLSTKAALRTGAGIVRLFHDWDMDAELAGAPWEIVKEERSDRSLQRIYEECKRAKCLMVGPGMGRTRQSKKLLKSLFSKIDLPTVIDADALFFLAENPSWKIPKGAVLTPHKGELERILGVKKSVGDKELHALCQAYVEKRQVTLLLKGGPTFIFHPGREPLVSLRGDPGMATAGTGDVLTGIIAALIAQGLSPYTAASFGAHLHGITGEIAALHNTSYGLIASDLIDFLPDALSEESMKDEL